MQTCSTFQLSRSRRLVCLLALVYAMALAGCRTPPDLRPFAEGTSQLAGAIKTTGRTVASEVDFMSTDWPEDQRKEAMTIAQKFTHQWTQRQALADALVEYSASLTAIAQAGDQGEESARALANSFSKLCGAIEIAMPPAAAVNAGVNLGAQLYGKFARNYAAKTLGEGMVKLQPAIDETAAELSHSLKNIEDSLDTMRDQNAQNVEDEMLDGIKVSTERNHLKVLSARRGALLKLFEDGTRKRDELRAELLTRSDDAREKEFARLANLNEDIRTELSAIEASLAAESEKLAPVDARKAANHERLTTQILMVRTVRAGLGDWAAAHSRLAAAALERKPLQVDDLVQTALEIRDLVKTVRGTSKE